MRTLCSLVVTGLCVSACTTERAEDGIDDDFVSTDTKADGHNLTEAQALAAMTFATKSEAELRAAGVSAAAANSLATYVAAADGRHGTADDQVFDSLAELDALDHVGPVTLEALLAASNIDEGAPGRHDVSILVPLPPPGGDLPWRASMAGRGGPLLPSSVYAQIDRSVFRELHGAEAEYAALRVVGVRIDPCFTVTLTSACQAQLRLVFQTLATDGRGTNDGAVHALYNLSTSELAELTSRLRTLVELAPENRPYAPLGVNRALSNQGMTGAYATELGMLIADYAGPETLARMTFMTRTDSRQGEWELGGFHIRASADTGFPAAGPIKIVGDETLQVIGNGAFFGGHRYNVTPAPLDPTGGTGLDSMAIAGLPAAAKTKLAAWALAQQSPLATVPDTTDCVSCHIAGHVSNALELVDPAFATLDRGPRAVGGGETFGDNLRAFGYFFNDPMVSIRTANETAAVVRALAAR